MLEKHLPPNSCCVVLHWFTGNKTEAQRAVDLGYYFSINAEMFKNERHRSTIASLPLNRILTETDGPFCQYDGRKMHPADVYVVVDLLAQITRVESIEISRAVLSNLNRIEAFG